MRFLRRALATWVSLVALSYSAAVASQTCIGEQAYLKRTLAAVKESLETARNFDLGNRAVAITEKGADGILLKGYLLEGTKGAGFMLIAQGNGMSARGVAASLAKLPPLRRSIVILDYRGHGENASDSPSLAGIRADYLTVWTTLIERHPNESHVLYGLSQGGIVATSMIDVVASKHGTMILDAIPSRLPHYRVLWWELFSCPKELDPIEQVVVAPTLPRLALVRGEEDKQITWRDSREVFEAAKQRGALVRNWPGLYHPLSPRDNDGIRMNNIQGIADELER